MDPLRIEAMRTRVKELHEENARLRTKLAEYAKTLVEEANRHRDTQARMEKLLKP